MSMRLPGGLRTFLSNACFMVGAVWAGAGILRWTFGTHITLPGLPPLGLEEVVIAKSIIVGLVLIATGGFLGRKVRDPSEMPAVGARPGDD